MTKGADGLWYVTTTPQVVGFHYYTLSIDGAVRGRPGDPDVFRLRLATTAGSNSRRRMRTSTR